MEPWHGMCPTCGENVFTGVRNSFTAYCDKCGVIWTMTDLEIYNLSHPSPEVVDIVNKLMELSYKLAMEMG